MFLGQDCHLLVIYWYFSIATLSQSLQQQQQQQKVTVILTEERSNGYLFVQIYLEHTVHNVHSSSYFIHRPIIRYL